MKRVSGIALLAAVAGLVPALAAPQPAYDLLFVGGMVFDGSGNPAIRADIGIRGDEVVAVGRLAGKEGHEAARTIDVSGLHVSPGWVDLHSHADRSLVGDDMEERKALNLVAQGITTVVMGADGRNPIWPIRDEIAAYESRGTGLNVVPMVGHSTVRLQVMGADHERPATDGEVARMTELVREGMEDGAWGLGAGPEYRPARFSETEEIIALGHVVAAYDGFYYSHQRSQSPMPRWQVPSIVDGPTLTGTDGMAETIRIGRETGIRVVGTHIKAKGPSSWGHSAKDVQAINLARAQGVQVFLDQYPFETFGGGPVGVIPVWGFAPPGTDRSGGLDDPKWRRTPGLLSLANLEANLADEAIRAALMMDLEQQIDLFGGADRLIVVLFPEDPSLVGKTVATVAADSGRSVAETLIDFARTGNEDLLHGVLIRPIAGDRFDVEMYMAQDYTATSTDAGIALEATPGRNPRFWGSYTRKIAHYTRDRGLITLPFMVRSSTSLPAAIVGMTDRGCLRVGCKADIVAFDYDRVEDNATIMNPDGPVVGMPWVLVNGQIAIEDGQATGALAGVVIKRAG
ncbi:MAG: amidohydrolase family protein [Acidobacteriota bacterium]|nr:amidohydrolase family protein [Acidobacteriota bacterium]